MDYEPGFDEERGSPGASAAPDPAARDFIPCIPIGEITSWEEPNSFRLLRWRYDS